MFSLLKCKLVTGRDHLKFISTSSPTSQNTDSDMGGANTYERIHKIPSCNIWVGTVSKGLSATRTEPNHSTPGCKEQVRRFHMAPKFEGQVAPRFSHSSKPAPQSTTQRPADSSFLPLCRTPLIEANKRKERMGACKWVGSHWATQEWCSELQLREKRTGDVEMERMLKLPLLHPWSVPRSLRKKYYGETSLAKSRQIAGGGHTKRTDAQKGMCQTLCLVRFPHFPQNLVLWHKKAWISFQTNKVVSLVQPSTSGPRHGSHW